jgi:hypothetical protein
MNKPEDINHIKWNKSGTEGQINTACFHLYMETKKNGLIEEEDQAVVTIKWRG